MKLEHFNTWEEAYDSCRERNVPMSVHVSAGGKHERAKIYPSGAYKPLTNTPATRGKDEG
jgi:hypothetical protein